MPDNVYYFAAVLRERLVEFSFAPDVDPEAVEAFRKAIAEVDRLCELWAG